jgi:hypothetical protein
MAVHGEVLLKLRHCCNLDCREPFPICACCDRGQRYCSQPCRARARVRQRRAANRRHQQSAEGRLDHRDRQKRYRRRRHTKSVTDQGSQTAGLHSPSKKEEIIQQWTASRLELRARGPRFFELRCTVCGRTGQLLDPFPRTCTRR